MRSRSREFLEDRNDVGVVFVVAIEVVTRGRRIAVAFKGEESAFWIDRPQRVSQGWGKLTRNARNRLQERRKARIFRDLGVELSHHSGKLIGY